MGHLHGEHSVDHDHERTLYRNLGRKIDGMQVRVPWSEQFYELTKALYSSAEADVVVKMPYTFSTAGRIAKTTGYGRRRVQKILDGLTGKGLVIDIYVNGEYVYMPSPLYIGIYEFTLMKTGGLSVKEKARFLHDYMKDNHAFYAANFGGDKKVSLMRSIPHQEVIQPEDYMEVLDYEKAVELVEKAGTYSLGNCSCRVEKENVGEKTCRTPIRTCIALGRAADYMIRNRIGEPAEKTEILEALSISREYNLVLNADNVKQRPRFICQCCSDCCMPLTGIRKYGHPNTVISSNFIAEIVDTEECIGCGKCARACPIDAIQMVRNQDELPGKKKKHPVIDRKICLGCGVCGLNCDTNALQLVKRAQQIFHPENTFERIMAQALERGTLQNQLFDNPGSIGHQTMRGILGGFLRLDPVKKVLMGDLLRSTFFTALRKGAELQGRKWLSEL